MPPPPDDAPPPTLTGPVVDPAVTVLPGDRSVTLPSALTASLTQDRFAPPTIPGFDLHELLGAGGMGVVWRATQVGLNRPAALKMILPSVAPRPTERLRFLAEADAVAAVRHPHVVQVYEFGEHLGSPFLAMELLSGGSLADRLKQNGRLFPADAARLVAKVARGVQAAHDQQIVHRDLKSGNVLFDAAGEPRVTDFGLAKKADGSDLTRTQAVVGTPAYMAPEQAVGGSKFVGPAADVWAVGVILYECLTGRRPFAGDDALSILRRVTEADPDPPRRLVPELPRDIELICMKCLAKEPTDRYRTAAALADDLDRFGHGEPVSVRPPGVGERFARWVRKHPTTAVASVFGPLVVMLTVGVLAVESLRRSAVSARDAEATARRELESAQDRLKRIGYARSIDLAHREYQTSDLVRANLLLDAARPEFRGWEWRYVRRLCRADLRTISANAGGVTAVATVGSSVITAGADKTARVWDADGKPLAVFAGHTAEVKAVTVLPGGKRAVSVGVDGTARVWDTATGTEVTRFGGHEDTVRAVVVFPDGTKAVSTGDDNRAIIWSLADGKEVRVLSGHTAPVYAVAVAGPVIVTGGADDTVRVWDAATGQVRGVLTGHTDTVTAVAVFPDNKRILTASKDGTARVWDIVSRKELVALRGHDGPVLAAAVSPTGTQLATAGADRTVRLWDVDGKPAGVFRGHEAAATAVAFVNPTQLVSGSADGTAKVWQTDDDPAGRVLVRVRGKIESAQLSPDGTRFAATGIAMPPAVYDADTGRELFRLVGHRGQVQCVAYSPDGTRLATSGVEDRVGKVWDATTGKHLFDLTGHVKETAGVRFSPDGQRILLTGRTGKVTLHDAADGKLLSEFVGHTGWVVNAAFRPDGTQVVTAGHDTTARVWDVATGTPVRVLRIDARNVSDVGYSPDGTRIVTAGSDRLARVWDADTGTELLTLAGHAGVVGTAQFDGGGTRIVTGGYDRLVKVWDAETGAELLTLRGHAERVTDAVFAPAGDRLYTASEDGTVRVWDARPRRE